MKGSRSVPLIENYRRMVAQAAWRAWRVLPKSIQTWISVEDMIEDGMFFAYRYAVRRFEAERGLAFSTGFYHSLHNYYIRNYIEWYGAIQRGWTMVEKERKNKETGKMEIVKVPIPINFKSMNMVDKQGEEKAIEEIVINIPDLQISADAILQNALVECFTVPALLKVHSDASPVLQENMVEWFIHRRSKVHKKSQKFQKLAGEFRELCEGNNIYCDDCIHLMRSPKCMDSLSRQLLGIPYSLDNPTPGIADNIW